MFGDVHVLQALRTPTAPAGSTLTEVLPSRLVAGLLRQTVHASERIALSSGLARLDGLILAGSGDFQSIRHAMTSISSHPPVSYLLQCGKIGAMEAIRQGALQSLMDSTGTQPAYVIAGGYEVHRRHRLPEASDMIAAITRPVLPPRTAADLLASRYKLSGAELDSWSQQTRQAARNARKHLPRPTAVQDINGLLVLGEDEPAVATPNEDKPLDIPASAWYVAKRFAPDLGDIPEIHAEAHCAPRVDGAALIFLGASAKGAESSIADAHARIAGIVSVDEGPASGFLAAHLAVHKVLKQAGWNAAQLDVLEIHDRFAAQALAVAHEFSIPGERINPMGGSLVHGDAGAASGALCVGRLFHQLQHSGRRGIAVVADESGHAVALAMEGMG